LTNARVAGFFLAATNTKEMVDFYQAALGVEFSQLAAYGTTLYRSQVGAFAITICPNTIAGVVAEQSRHQVTYAVESLEDSVNRLAALGYEAVLSDASSPRSAVATDPDGNTLELSQA